MIANISDYKTTAFISIDNGLDHKILFFDRNREVLLSFKSYFHEIVYVLY